jgi:Cellulose biosynthesis protein BcsS
MKHASLTMVAMMVLGASASEAHELIGGWEGGPGNGYAFLEPVFSFPDSGMGSAFVIRPTFSYLYYDTYDSAGGLTQVSSPGESLGIAYRLRTPRLTLTLGPGFEVRQEHRDLADGTRQSDTLRGATLSGDMYFQATSLTSCTLIGSYEDANHYVWSRAGIKRQITNTDFRDATAISLGLELTEQGNQDVRRDQAGAVLGWEFLRAHASLQFHAGVSRSRFPTAPSAAQAYFGVGLYRAFQ